MNDDESSSDEELPPPTKQNNPSKPTKKSYFWEKKSFQKIDKMYEMSHPSLPGERKELLL